MRRFLIFMLCLLLAGMPVLATEATGTESTQPSESQAAESVPPETGSAAMEASGGTVTSYHMDAVLNNQGSVQVTADIKLNITKMAEEVVIPLGKGASNCYVNGVRMTVRKVQGVPAVKMHSDAGVIGDLQLNVTYQLSKCVDADGIFSLPLLPASYAYPIESLSFQVTLPGKTEEKPQFTSGYLGEDADNYLKTQQEEAVISGDLLSAMRDHDSLTMTLQMPETMFSRRSAGGGTDKTIRVILLMGLLLMILYWALRLSWKPVRVGFQSHPPLGETAGETEALLTGGNISFSLMVLTWAQMGYLTIRRGRNITLHRRMDMGNERSNLEIRAFERLFRRRDIVSVEGQDFARLRAHMDAQRFRARGQFAKNSGNPAIAKVLGLILGAAAGVGIGDGLFPPMQVRFLVLIPCALAGIWASFLVQKGMCALWGRNKGPVWAGGLALLLGTLLGVKGDLTSMAMLWALIEVLAGGFAMFGGRRTEDGRRTVQAELGMIRFFCGEYKEQHQGAQARNPSYYYDLAPYALALGVDRQFARKFQKMALPPCGYFVCHTRDNRAKTWQKVLRETVDLMDGRPVGLERYFLGRLILALSAALSAGKKKNTRRRRRSRPAARG